MHWISCYYTSNQSMNKLKSPKQNSFESEVTLSYNRWEKWFIPASNFIKVEHCRGHFKSNVCSTAAVSKGKAKLLGKKCMNQRDKGIASKISWKDRPISSHLFKWDMVELHPTILYYPGVWSFVISLCKN